MSGQEPELTGTPRTLPDVTGKVRCLDVLQDVPTASGQRHDVIERDAPRVRPWQVATDPTPADSTAPAISLIDIQRIDSILPPHLGAPLVARHSPVNTHRESAVASPSMHAGPRAEAFHVVLELTRQQESNRSALLTAHLDSGLVWPDRDVPRMAFGRFVPRAATPLLPDAAQEVDATNDATQAGNGEPPPSRGAPRAPLGRRTFSHGRLEDNPAGATDSRWVTAALWLGHLGPSYRRMGPS